MSDQKNHFRSCPYCGAVGYEDEGVRLRLTSTSNGYFAIICSCGAAGPIRDSEEKAIEAWNKRDYSDREPSESHLTESMRDSSPSLNGNLESFDFPTILQILSSAHKNGILHIRNGEEIRTIYFKDGKIIAANGKEGLRLGEIGCKKGLISQEQLQKALVDTKKTGRRMGDVLLALDYLKEDSLKEIIRHQISETVLELFLWQKGDFEYQDFPVEFDERGIEVVNTMRIILEAAVRKDELAAA